MRWSAAACALVLAGTQSCRCGTERPVAVTATALDASVQPAEGAVLTGSRGQVELQRGSGAWGPAILGDRIGVRDGLRTPGDGEAELSVDGVRVKLHDRTEIRVTAVSAGVLRARVRGRVESQVDDGRGRVSLQVGDSETVATSTGGHFLLTADGQNVAVAVTSGAARVGGSGANVQVQEGEITRLGGDGHIRQPTRALRKVLLAVQWPGDKTNQSSLPLSGRVAAGSRVYVQGQPVEVAPSGEFHTEVRLYEGRQKIAVVTVDPFGRRKSAESEVTRDQSLPQVQVGSPWRR